MKILLKNADIITSVRDNMHIKNGFVSIIDDKIDKVCQRREEITETKFDREIDCKNRIVMPGLVNAHTHTPMTILRNYADDLALEDWLFNHIFPQEAKLDADDIYWGSQLGVAEMIRSGTTAFADMYYYTDETARVVKESGIKANLSLSAYSFTFEGYGPVFIDNTKAFEEFYKNWNNSCDGRVKCSVLVHSPYIYDMKSMSDSAAFAKSIGAGIHIHILETATELEETKVKFGKDGASACLDAGIYDGDCIAAHCVHLSEENIQMFREKGVNVVHNPTSNLKLGSGIANVPQMLKVGVNVALGTDGTASNNNLNMFEEINLAALIHKGNNRNPKLVSATEAIIMGTANGANAIGFGKESGTIEEGKKADIVLIDTDKIHLTPFNNPISALAYSVQASDVDTVIIDGKIVMEKGELKTIDVEKAKFKVNEISQRLSKK